jgi:hypothetical protein
MSATLANPSADDPDLDLAAVRGGLTPELCTRM